MVSTALANCPRYKKEMNQYPLRVHKLAHCPCNMGSMRTREGAGPRFMMPQHVLISVCRSTFTLAFRACRSRVLMNDRIQVTEPNLAILA